MIRLDRDYSSKGIISAGSGIYVYDDNLNKFVILVPTSDMPAGAGAPDTIDNPILTVSKNGQVEGKQSVQQKEYTYNYNRDNNRRLAKYTGKQVEFLERDGMEFTGNRFLGELSFDKDAFADNEIMNGKIYITVNEDLGYVDDVRDLIGYTSIITSALVPVTVTGTGSATFKVKTNPADATITATSESTTVATASVSGKEVTITGVAAGTTIVKLTVSKSGEASSERTVMVTVE